MYGFLRAQRRNLMMSARARAPGVERVDNCASAHKRLALEGYFFFFFFGCSYLIAAACRLAEICARSFRLGAITREQIESAVASACARARNNEEAMSDELRATKFFSPNSCLLAS